MKLREITKNRTPTPKVVKTSLGEVDFTPTFNNGDIVSVTPSAMKTSKSLERLKDIVCIVDYCKVADLGDMVVEVLYLQKTDKRIENPYLIEHFKQE